MPEVVIKYMSQSQVHREAIRAYLTGPLNEKMMDGILNKLHEQLRDIVAKHLNVEARPEARLTSDDIDLEFREAGRWDILSHHICIKVMANIYPEREETREARAVAITEDIARLVPPEITFDVWLPLVTAAFVERV